MVLLKTTKRKADSSYITPTWALEQDYIQVTLYIVISMLTGISIRTYFCNKSRPTLYCFFLLGFYRPGETMNM